MLDSEHFIFSDVVAKETKEYIQHFLNDNFVSLSTNNPASENNQTARQSTRLTNGECNSANNRTSSISSPTAKTAQQAQTLPKIQAKNTNIRFKLSGTQHVYTGEQLATFCNRFLQPRYDTVYGVLKVAQDNNVTPDSYSQAFVYIVKNSLWPSAIALQAVNVLETTALWTAIWEHYPEHRLNVYSITPVAVMAACMLINTYQYSVMRAGATREEMKEQQRKITTMFDTIMSNLSSTNTQNQSTQDLFDPLIRIATRPSHTSRLQQEIRLWVAASIKLIASYAVLSAELEGANPWAIAGLALLMGTIEGIDTAFNMVLAIPHLNKSVLQENEKNILPVYKAIDRALIFPYVANFPFFPWLMAKAGPAGWLFVKARASVTFMKLLGLSSDNILGGLYGIYTIATVCAATVAAAFSFYNIDENLAHELPTQRNFHYGAKLSRQRLGAALAGALPLAGAAAFAGHLIATQAQLSATLILATSASAGLGVLFALTVALSCVSSHRANQYAHIMEMRFVPDLLIKLDNLHWIDKSTLFLLGGAAEIYGRYKNNMISASLGDATLFLAVTAFIATMHSKSMASMIRYATAQMFLYGAALLTWVLNCALSVKNLMQQHPVSDHPHHLSPTETPTHWYAGAFLAASVLGFLAGTFDFRAIGEHVPALVDDAKPNRHESLVGSGFRWMRNKVSACCSSNPNEDMGTPLITQRDLPDELGVGRDNNTTYS